MKVTIESSLFGDKISTEGAELRSFKEKETGREYIWQRDPVFWNGSAPVLFPIVGGLKNGIYKYNGNTYSLGQHGFARKSTFNIVETKEDEVVFELRENGETFKQYPFKFILQVKFNLFENRLVVEYYVQNKSKERMYYSIGSHPAFNLPFAGGKIEHYSLHFSENENIERYFFKDGMHLKETEEVFNNSRQIFLNRKIFDKGPIILKNQKSGTVSIINSKNNRKIIVDLGGAPFLGIWSKSNGAPFLCIEPWFGIPDPIDTDGDITKKEGIECIESEMTGTHGYTIDII